MQRKRCLPASIIGALPDWLELIEVVVRVVLVAWLPAYGTATIGYTAVHVLVKLSVLKQD